MSKVLDTLQERCRDSRLVETILIMSDECEGDIEVAPDELPHAGESLQSPTPSQQQHHLYPQNGISMSEQGQQTSSPTSSS
eukprot:CAMPEP_0202458940 /NCGR_PEP_ID=MMETSP1360-20130828/28694_1 /ASSEMBLY_ACC=CAM_ASM_000848 /TAXON_ID=515479 /ORGANISM="Licmophora paradoxa, Strain CCMP2313" /LENGTH=80 /DNA_ID=CAMNT_0049079707 /DNA_START=24 /DNA_END=263 /DNA_ORIENTATION=-